MERLMDWEAINEEKLLEAIEAAEFVMEPRILAFWLRIRIRPLKTASGLRRAERYLAALGKVRHEPK